MEANFWHQRWSKNEIAFHEREANPFLVEYSKKLNLREGSRVFVPLCGKTLDIHWLLSKGYRVAGAELSKIAIEQLFGELGVKPKVESFGELDRYSAENIEVFTGDIFDLSNGILGSVDAIYDRAALVALPEKMRDHYTAHLMEITGKSPQLLVCYVYDQSLMDGPPFSIQEDEVRRHYSKDYELKLLESKKVAGGLKKSPAKENVWLLEKI
ncbi:thiopurine S-methyltransferase [Leptospira sp. 201903070]|uniref:Thiopurine S-methyltransferase n=1 Tax=Leptospira ainlahdjerensis TaxID=2810033 RepID=A0ABS2UA39_9LEPT|nr:thiopurine S-methyltransferase [Leptospira ainlahdjerensis]MBM9577029.1 thiopurine S-methyltransferase [Leptospira ainlahdjerensis]